MEPGQEKKAARPDPIEPGLHLVIGDLGKILRSAPIRNAPRRLLQPPFLGPRTLKDIKKPMSELVLDLLRDDGRVLDSFGWPWTSEVFYDRVIEAVYEEMKVGRVEYSPPPKSIRVLRVPVPRSAAFLLFSQSAVTVGVGLRPKALIRKGLALYSLASPPPLRPPKLPDFAERLGITRLPGKAPFIRPR